MDGRRYYKSDAGAKCGSGKILKAMSDIGNITAEVKSGSAEMLTGSNQVSDKIKRLTYTSKTINGNMDEMAAGTIQINNAVQKVNEITQKNKQSIGHLVFEVKKFKV